VLTGVQGHAKCLGKSGWESGRPRQIWPGETAGYSLPSRGTAEKRNGGVQERVGTPVCLNAEMVLTTEKAGVALSGLARPMLQ
jgi:hypothetical protein